MGRRRFRLCAPKNWVRRKYQQPIPLIVSVSRSIAENVLFVAQVRVCDLRGWILIHASVSQGIRVCKLDNSGLQSTVSMTLNIVGGKCTVLSQSTPVLQYSDRVIAGLADFQALLDELNTLSPCPGIDAAKYSPLVEKHDGTFRDPTGKFCIITQHVFFKDVLLLVLKAQ